MNDGLLARRLRQVEREVLGLAVLHHQPERRLVELDLVENQLAGEQREDPGSRADAVAREGGALPVRRFDATSVSSRANGTSLTWIAYPA